MTTYIKDATLLTGAAVSQGAAVAAGIVRKFTKCVAYNGTAGTVQLRVYVVPNLGAANSTTRVLNYALRAEETYLCPEVVGNSVGAGGLIYAEGLNISFGFVSSDTSNA